jgi:hypothetical protein
MLDFIIVAFKVLLAALVLLVLFVGTAPLIALVYVKYSHRRSVKFVSTTPCPKCRKPLGRASFPAGQDHRGQSFPEKMEQHPDIMYRLAPPIWKIECSHCGFRLNFYPDENRFEIPSIFPIGSVHLSNGKNREEAQPRRDESNL